MSNQPQLSPVEESDAWDTGELGRDEKYVKRSSAEDEASVEAALDLQLISIRLQKELLEQLKFIAKYHGIGYQPMMRDILCRWARTEMLNIASQMKQQLEAKQLMEESARKLA
jgi:predicted DNA binding CopG/RHH family protein